MKFAILLLSLLTLACCSTVSLHAGQLLYLASQGEKTITAYRLNEKTGALDKQFHIDLPGNPGPMAFSPDKKFVYAAVTGLADKKAGVATLSRSADGSLKLLHTANITTRAPYIRTSKQGGLLLAAHYGAGDVTVYRITDGICTGELLDQKTTEKTSHCIEIDPSGKFVFVPHTAPNKVYQFRLNEKSGKLTPNDPPFAVGPDEDHRYHQPRHITFHPKLNIAYTSNESGGGITAWQLDTTKGTLSKLQTLSTLPPGYEGRGAGADIRMTPDGRFVYVSNRDYAKREKDDPRQDSLAGFAIDSTTGKLKAIGTFPTAHAPRSFCIDLSGNFVFVGGQHIASLVSYKIDTATGKLKKLSTYDCGEVPIWVMCGEVK